MDVRTDDWSFSREPTTSTYDPLHGDPALSEGLISEFDEKSIDLRPISPRELRRGNRSKILSRRSLIMEPFSDAKDEISCKVMNWPCLAISNGEKK